MPSKNTLVQVLLPLSLPMPLTYGLSGAQDVFPGDVVLVPLGKKEVVGVVWGVSKEDVAPNKLKYVTRKFDIPPISKPLRTFVDWVAEYTFSTPGNVLRMVLSVKKALEPEKQIKQYVKGVVENIRITEARQKILNLFFDPCLSLTKEEIINQTGVGSSVIAGMVKAGALKEVWVPPQQAAKAQKAASPPELSKGQQKVVSCLCQKIHAKTYSTTLLDGVTGSGKTEVYLAAIEEAFKEEGAQALVMLPEIILTDQIVNRFERRFGFSPTVWHSGLSPATREKNWRAIANGSARLVVGARSALFLPYKKLKLIVVDEEHDSSYKQEEGVIYQARDMAVVRASIESIPILLVSATPSIETVKNVEEGKYDKVHLPSRHGGAVLPDIEVVDMRQFEGGKKRWVSNSLAKALANNMESGKQSMLFLNRRGYAPLTLCRKCGHRFQCKSCSSWLVEHRNPPQLLCHHCGYSEPLAKSCPECGSEEDLVSCGPGVERVAEEVKELLPQARVTIMTSDKLTSAEKASATVQDILQGGVDIIIGTQIVAKGHHFPNLTLVGIVDADIGLSGGDLRAAERSYQLLHQVAGRAGREKDHGTVIIQSYMPDNAVIKALASGGRDEFVSCESSGREFTRMPPYSRLAAMVFSGPDAPKALKAAQQLVRRVPTNSEVEVMGPVAAPMFLLRGNYRYRVLVRAPRNINIQKWLKKLMAGLTLKGGLKVKVDIDPYSFM